MKLPGPLAKLLSPPAAVHHGVMGVFPYVDDATAAVRALRQAGFGPLAIFSPIPYPELERAMDQGPSLVRWVTFGGGLFGITAGFALCIYSVLSWPLVVGGKELISIPPFVVIGYECMILCGALFNLLGMLALARLPQTKSRAPYDPRFTEDRIGVWVPCQGEAVKKVEQMLRGHQAEDVQAHG